MADNVTLVTPSGGSSGDQVAADDIGGVKHQRVKISIGADGAAADCASSNPLPVSDASGSLTVDNAGTFAVQESGGALTALQLLDDAVATDGSTATTKGFTVCGTDGTNAQTISTNSTGHVNIADGGNTITVDNGGTFAVQAAQSGTFTVQPGNTANTTAWLVTGTGGSFPVTDSSGSLTVDAPVGTPVFVRLSDGSAAITTLPVSLASVPSHAVTNAGTFAVQVDGSALTSLQLIDDAVATTAASITSKGFAVSGTDGTNARILKTDTSGELQVDVLSMPTTTVTGTGGTFPVTDSGGSLTVDDGSSSLTVDNAGTFAVQESGGALTSLQLIDDAIATDDAAFAPATGKVMMVGFEFDDSSPDSVNEGDAGAARMSANRNIYTTIRDAAGNERGVNVTSGNALTVDGSASTQPVSGNVGTLPLTSGGLSVHRTISAASTNSTSVKASAGQIYQIYATNINASPAYLKLYNAASGPSVGSDTPVQTYLIPGGTAGGVLNLSFSQGMAFSTGIAFGLTTGVADNNSTAVAANEVLVNIGYK